MKQPQMNSMRRKVIADAAPQRKANDLQEEQNTSLETINQTLKEVQAGVEMTAEASETAAGSIKESIKETNTSLGDTNAGIELAVDGINDSSIGINTLNDTATAINDKLSKLADLLQGKVQSPGVPSTEVISNNIPEVEVDQPLLENLMAELVPPFENKPRDADFFPADQIHEDTHEEDSKKDKKDKNDNDSFKKALADLTKVVKGGFKTSISLTDKISSMLFSYTVSAVANMAKTAAMIMMIIMAIDVIQVHFKYWSKLFESNFKEFSDIAGKWGPVLSEISNMAQNIKQAFDEGSWTGLATAIINGLVNVLDKLGENLLLGMSQMTAALLEKFGMTDKANDIRGAAYDRFQERTGAVLTDDEQTLVAKYKDKERIEEEEKSPTRRKMSAWTDRYVTGKIDDDEYKKRISQADQKISDPLFEGKSEEQRLEIYKQQGKMKAELKRSAKYIDDTNVNNKNRMKTAETTYKSASENFKALVSKNPELAKELEPDYKRLAESWDSKQVPKAGPELAGNKEEAQQIKNIEQIQAQQKTNNTAPSQSPVQVNTAISKKQTTIHNMNPVTSSPAPGMGSMTQSN